MEVTIAMVSAFMARTEHLLLEVKEDSVTELVKDLLSDLRFIVQRYLFLLKDHEDEMNQDKGKQKKILGLAHAIENSVESYFVKNGTSASSGGRIKSFFKRSHVKRLLDTLHGFRPRVDAIRDSLLPVSEHDPDSEILSRSHDYIFPVSRTSSWSDRPSTSSVSAMGDSVTPSEVIVVERDVQKLLSILLSKDTYVAAADSSSFFSICGKRGLGKTTLAKLVYNHPALVEHFDCRAWASGRSDAHLRDILESILISLSPTPVKEKIVRMDMMQLNEKVYQAQSGRRCFIVFDDVSSIDTIRLSFPKGRGTTILITTRSSEVARQLNGYIHHMEELTLEKSCMLFKSLSKISEHQEVTARQMEIGEQIAGACGGIPLAIVVIGRILRGKNSDEWKRVLERLQGPGDVVMNVLCLSYNYLPLHLKPCFLYLGHLILEQVIPVEKLYLLWMAEGLISNETLYGNRRMDVAEDYLKKLVFTSLVMAETENESAIRRFKSCQLQGLVHDLCVSFGMKENFFQVINTSYQAEISSSVSRVAIYLNLRDGDNVALKITEPKKIRALLFFETKESPPAKKWPTGVADLAACKWMRVLNFDGVDFVVKKLPNGLGKLRYLRYLSFQRCYLNELPSFVGELKLLEILDLRVAKDCRMIISNNYILRNVTRLSHLYLPTVFQTIGKLKLDTLRRLELLENFNSSLCDMDDLLRLENLQIVTVNITHGLPKDLNKIINFVHSNQHLCQLSLVIKNFDCYYSEERLSIFEMLWDLAPLHALHVEGYMKKLPTNPNLSYSKVTEIVFDESEFDNDPMPILGQLHNLRSLVLRNDAFVGDSMVCCESGFWELRRLELINLRFLENWVVQKGAMENLSVLVIKECRKLAMVPKSMNMQTLRELKIISMPKDFQETIRKTAQRMEGLILTFDN